MKEILELIKEKDYAKEQGYKLLESYASFAKIQLQFQQRLVTEQDYIKSLKNFLNVCIEVLDFLEKIEQQDRKG
ncbi:hypothetical protein [Kosmotoga pacifica]|uniref:Uncharacterized protein n=1 Tax=Kosmotoga pacifica TaxID=1330330 RepID=A0A0G2Z4T4_9BACT|nr:hypothetical protein [Kosmotoga pacifica]AKI96562.1 hypothetical protein IX53_00580 [Kosmotoga pacifica]